MSNGRVLSIGNNAMPQTTGMDAVKRQNEAVEVMFADMINMGTSFQPENRTFEPEDKKISSANSDKMTADGKNVSSAYEKFHYKEKTIQSEPKKNTEHNIEKIKEELDTFSEKVVKVLQEELHVSEEEIKDAMNALGLQYLDLLDVSNLANLVMKLGGSEKVNQLLCNEAFATVFQKVYELGNEMLKSLQMTVEELQKVNASAMESLTEQLKQDGIKKVPDGMVTKPEEHLTQNVEADTVQETTAKETIVVEDLRNGSGKSGQMEQNDLTSGENLVKANEKPHQLVSESQPVENSSFDTTLAGMIANRFENTTVESLPSYVSVTDIMEQFVEHTKVTLSAEITKMEMQLNPEHLGKVYLEITENQGSVTAKIQTQNAIVKEALEMQIADLKQNLSQAGVKVDAIEVTIASHEFERNLEQDENSKKQQEDKAQDKNRHHNINLNNLDELSGVLSEKEELSAKMMAEQGNSVDLTA